MASEHAITLGLARDAVAHGFVVCTAEGYALVNEIDRLRAALEQCLKETTDACPDCNGCGNAHDIASKALEDES